MSSDATNSYESKTEGLESPASFVKMWLDALDAADSEEKDWRDEAQATAELFRGKRKTDTKNRAFNIFHANVETLAPAVYNSTPVPDVRRRFSDADPAGKVVADLLERDLSFALDSYDFNDVMRRVVRDGEIVGRGIPRVRYVPTIQQVMEEGKPVLDPQTQKAIEEVVYEQVRCDYVQWKHFRRGPANVWCDLPWQAFQDFLTRDEVRKLCGDARDKNGNLISEMVPLNYVASTKDGSYNKTDVGGNSIFRRACVWQIWDREGRKVISLCPDYPDAPLAMVDDPLSLEQFFPTVQPYQPILVTDSLEPVIPYQIYQDLVEELNTVTKRINRLVKQLRPRGGYAGDATDLKAINEADDGELVPLNNPAALNEGGLEKMIAWYPMEPTVAALKVLVEQRNEIKAVIYEVTGIADILRGATNPNETLGAQQLKAQWGSMRVQDRQAEVARVARDLMRLKAEIIANKFSWETITAQAGIKVPEDSEKQAAQAQIAQFEQMHAQQQQMAVQQSAPGPDGLPPMPSPIASPPIASAQPPSEEIQKVASEPSRGEVEPILRSDIMRKYRIDIESDSTIRGDLTRNQQTMNLFLQGTAQYVSAMAPILQIEKRAVEPIVEIYTAFARQFKLGKQAEDALERLSEMAHETAKAPPQPDPALELQKAQGEQEMALAKEKHGQETEARNQEMAFAREKHDQDMRLAVAKHLMKPPPKPAGQNGAKSSGPSTPGADAPQTELPAMPMMNGADESGEPDAAVALIAELLGALKKLNAPKRIIRDEATGRAIGVEPLS